MADIKINSDNYAGAAVSTECPYAPVFERLGSEQLFTAAITALLLNSIDLGNDQDALKKTLFYGKAIPEAYRASFIPSAPDVREGILQRLAADHRVIRLLHAVIGLQTEASELQAALAAYLFEGQPIDWTNVSEELGDSLWYVALAADVQGVSVTDIMRQNIDKLRLRFPNKFSAFDALNRDLKAERSFLEESTVCS